MTLVGMGLLLILILSSCALLSSASQAPTVDADCDDLNIFEATDEALRSYNNAKAEGNQFVLYRITDAKIKCSDVDGLCPLSCADERLNCYLVDNNGFIVVSRVQEQTGVFLGEVDGSLMTQLLQMEIFRQVTLYDYQAMCKLPYHHHSGGRNLLNPIFALFSAAQWLLSNLVLKVLFPSLSQAQEAGHATAV
ncbi:voltage-dependent calcium channel subunit alpha-2/delta-4-like isoform X2 [Mixophyes fleayi]|uniref:voltage-dependent calcium channel subunit alpha-2/delta-4-like isoform X2 n=1 Tax=Mixophyes fleayi TaxID=3061075 RepID=UPI003F4DFAB0